MKEDILKIPPTVTTKVIAYVDLQNPAYHSYGTIKFDSFDWRGYSESSVFADYMDQRLVIGEMDIEIPTTIITLDLRTMAVTRLEQEKEKLKAETQVQLNKLDDQIAQLKCLTYQKPIDESDSDC